MAGPTVTLTFAGDAKPATAAFDDVGSAADDMGRKVSDSSDSFDKTTEAFDSVDTKAMGFRDTLTGVQDTMGGVSQIAKGDLAGGLLTLGAGVGDLASGFVNFLIPAFGKIIAATWAWTASLLANPVVLIVVGIIALIAVIILLWKNWDTVSAAMGKAWDWVKDKAGAAGDWIRDKWNGILDWFKGLPGRMKSMLSGMWDGIKDGFRTAVNWVIDKWNNFSLTLGGGQIAGIDLPSVTLNTPNVPRLHSGGRVPGAPGTDVLTMLQAGERVTSAADVRRGAGADITIRFDAEEAFLAWLRRAVTVRGGVNLVFGGS